MHACVSLSQRKAWLTRNGRPTYGPVPIAHGGRENPTPTGTYPVSWKDEVNTSSIYGTPMPYSVFFAPGGIAFHQGDVRTDSHGCVRLTMPAAKAFFAALQPGELVQVVP
ncbi:L,D-transpeptidase [Actinophytocola gossypii]|uniref:L,D-transpeptidase n=1 Tax=Actinophytocola gossypii TaxID=2812003 RepID=A0ABT2JI12_9PSEU|nr:L,D-transpeptidase [Actinophytocola gossypii]MCT2587518.1 L,D-transpeptidase [Actinophytocola gossypii]